MTPLRRRTPASRPVSVLAACVAVHGCGSADETEIRYVAPAVREGRTDVQLPAISGGTMAMLPRGRLAVSDPERDLVHVVDASGASPVEIARIPLAAGDEPGRLVSVGADTFAVVLRASNAVAWVDASTAAVTRRTDTCAQPRGLDWDAAAARLWVACEDGWLEAYTTAGERVARVSVAPDLRDVVVTASGLEVSTFRSAQLFAVDPSLAVRDITPSRSQTGMRAHVAWRTRRDPLTGHARMLHQFHAVRAIDLTAAHGRTPYGGDAMVNAGWTQAVTVAAQSAASTAIGARMPMVLPVDFACSPDGSLCAVATAGSGTTLLCGAGGVACGGGTVGAGDGDPVAVEWLDANRLAVQVRDPSAVYVFSVASSRTTRLGFDVEPLSQAGHAAFHRATPAGLACASCHPEGRDDGHVWNFVGVGARRTPRLEGGLLATAPFHWDGDLADVPALVHEVFQRRMGSSDPGPAVTASLGRWLDGLPAARLPPLETLRAAAVSRGQAVFERADVGCASCHGGPMFTNNQTVDVGTGHALQVPSLRGLRWRAPFMHDGCASRLLDRFTDTACGGGERHGHTARLSESETQDLVAYLETL